MFADIKHYVEFRQSLAFKGLTRPNKPNKGGKFVTRCVSEFWDGRNHEVYIRPARDVLGWLVPRDPDCYLAAA